MSTNRVPVHNPFPSPYGGGSGGGPNDFGMKSATDKFAMGPSHAQDGAVSARNGPGWVFPLNGCLKAEVVERGHQAIEPGLSSRPVELHVFDNVVRDVAEDVLRILAAPIPSDPREDRIEYRIVPAREKFFARVGQDVELPRASGTTADESLLDEAEFLEAFEMLPRGAHLDAESCGDVPSGLVARAQLVEDFRLRRT